MIKFLITIHISKFITFDFIYLFIYLFQIKQIKTKLILKSKKQNSLQTKNKYHSRFISQSIYITVNFCCHDASEIKTKN